MYLKRKKKQKLHKHFPRRRPIVSISPAFPCTSWRPLPTQAAPLSLLGPYRRLFTLPRTVFPESRVLAPDIHFIGRLPALRNQVCCQWRHALLFCFLSECCRGKVQRRVLKSGLLFVFSLCPCSPSCLLSFRVPLHLFLLSSCSSFGLRLLSLFFCLSSPLLLFSFFPLSLFLGLALMLFLS